MKFQIDHARFTYRGRVDPGRELFHDLSLTVSQGETVAILGPEGSGKTTLLHLLAGLLVPDAGTLLIDGTNPHNDPVARVSLHRRMGVTFQFPEEQFLRESVAEEFREVLSLRNVPQPEIVPRMEESLAWMGLDPKILPSRSPFTLSLGQSRRVALALVLASRPDGVFMDEPTSGMDASGAAVTVSVLRKLEHTGATIIIATHDVGFAAETTRRTVILNGGKIISDGKTEAILSNVPLLGTYGYTVAAPTSLSGLQNTRERGSSHPESKQHTSYIRPGDRRQPEP